ncbi:MAG: rod shape-determining protein MreC [Mariprofundaceae bacterium]|nr:rod shape-determining protein MreC [Mariprofundaceae bacterium]
MPRRHMLWRVVLGLLIFVAILALQRMPIGQYLTLGLSPLISTLHAPARWWHDSELWLQEHDKLQTELIETRNMLEQQTALIQQGKSLAEENTRLRKLLKITNIHGYTWRAAQVLGRSPDKKSQRLILQVQSKPDDVIVSSSGLVGLVDKSHAGSAVVRTILDASLAVPVTIPGSPLAALIRGQGDHLLVDFIPLDQVPAIGAILQTSGAGGIFPPGISVARITHIEALQGRVFARIEAKPTAHWQRDNWLAIASRMSSPTDSSAP